MLWYKAATFLFRFPWHCPIWFVWFIALEIEDLQPQKGGLSAIDYEEVKAALDRINKRINVVHVRIETTRDSEQKNAVDKINQIIRYQIDIRTYYLESTILIKHTHQVKKFISDFKHLDI